uniref:Cytochrome P450 CYP3029A1 n=2 Tax=Tigriopus japonicus TaxID=158387 RepID=A0A088DHW6_TIGJA|nr:cytochrome P450 CYP3029A1 [Tigriopus japonicus]
MLSSYLILFTFALVAFNFIYKFAQKYRNLPPGPLGVPILGYLPFLDVNNLGESFKTIAKSYGDIFSIRVGTEMAVVLNSYEAIKAAFSKAELCARPNTFMFRFFSQGENGIASTSGEKWEVQRKFTHANLKALGFGQNKMETFIKDEIHDLIELLEEKSKSGQPVEIGYDINVSIVNVIWALITGERKPHHDQKLRDFLTSVNKGIELASTSGILLFMPFLIKIFPESLFGIDKMRKWMKHSYGYLQEVIDQHKDNHTDTTSNQDFIDAFLSEMKKDGAHPSFNEFQLLVLCSELFGAGGEPTSVTLKWALRFLALNPHVQAKAQAEIEQVVGHNRMVDLEDRPNLPYVQAMIHEIIRFSDIHPIGVMHSPSEDTELEGFKLPKGTFIFPNFHAVHRDPRHWEKPEELYPEHWLDANGQFVPNHEGFIAFGAGKRKCPGQDVAQMELFSFVANLIQKFNFKLPASDCGTIETSMGCVVSPKPYDLVLEARY